VSFSYYCAPNGDDNNPGTLISPWSITALNSKQSTYRGTNVGIIGDIAGTQTPIQYGTIGGVQTTIYSYLNSTQNQPFLNIDGGTVGSPTYIGSCNSSGTYVRGWAVIDCSNPSGGAHPSLDATLLMGQNGNSSTQVPHPGNITIDGLTIKNFCYCAITLEYTGGTAQAPLVQNCELYNVTSAVSNNNPGCIRFDNTNGAQVLNCSMHDCVTTSSGSFYPYAYPGIMSYNSTDLIVTNCTFYNIVAVEQKDGYQNATISYCYMDSGVFGAPDGGLSYGSSYYIGINNVGQTTTMHHNIVLGMIYLIGAIDTQYLGNWEFYNNTCYVTSDNPIFNLNHGTGSTFNCYNNVLLAQTSWNGSYGAAKFLSASTTLAPEWDYNYYTTAPTFYTGSSLSYASWQALGFDAHSHTGGSPFSATPTAQVPTSFTLSNSSPAYTGGVSGAICGAIDGSGTVGVTWSSSSYSLTLLPGSFAFSGAAMNVGLSLALAAGSFAFTGESANAAIGTQVQPGDFAFAGSPVTFTYSNPTPVTMPIMPNCVGIDLYPALAALQNAGVYVPSSLGYFGTYPISVKWVQSNAEPGTVIGQSPPSGTPTLANSAVTLTCVEYATAVAFP
jgi:hypothetical protein